MSSRSSRPSSQSSDWSDISMVRLALVTSVAWTPPRAPPVRFQSSQLSMVPKTRPAAAGCLAHAVDVVEDPAELAGREVGGRPQAGDLPDPCRRARRLRAGSSAGRCGCPARRSRCTTAGRSRGSQTTVVSRWLVMPMAARSEASIRASASAVRITVAARSAISTGSCSTHPGRGRICWCSSWRLATGAPSVVEDHEAGAGGPWSIAPTYSAMAGPPWID